MKKILSGIVLTLLFFSILTVAFDIGTARAETITETEPTIERVDLSNGTTLIIVDYQNGTVIKGKSTYHPGKGSLQPLGILDNESFPLEIPVSGGGNQCVNDPSLSRDILFGFNYTWDIFPKWSHKWEVKWFGKVVGRAEFEIGLDFGFGLQLPVRITIDYPEPMLSNETYIVNATLQTLDWAEENELILYFHCGAHLSVSVIGLKGDWHIGPWFDGSRSFETPLGPDDPLELPSIGPFELANLGLGIGGVSIGFSVTPKFYCDRIEAIGHVSGNATLTSSPLMSWSSSGEKRPLNIHTTNLDGNGSALVSIDNFKYIIDQSEFDFNFVIDPYGLLDWIPKEYNPYEVTLFTLDASEFLPDLKLGIHPGYPDSIGVSIYVEREHKPFIHDLAVTSVTASDHTVYQGEPIQISVIVENKGNVTETVSVIAYYGNCTIGTAQIKNLTSNANVTLTFHWDTVDVFPCNWYTLKAEVLPVAEELDVTNNILAGDSVKIKPLGDVNGDDNIDMRDLSLVAVAYGESPGRPRWNPDADVNKDNIVDMKDLVIIARDFGKTWI